MIQMKTNNKINLQKKWIVTNMDRTYYADFDTYKDAKQDANYIINCNGNLKIDRYSKGLYSLGNLWIIKKDNLKKQGWGDLIK